MSKAESDAPLSMSSISNQSMSLLSNSYKLLTRNISADSTDTDIAKLNRRHKKWRMHAHTHSERLAQKMHGGLLKQIDSEISSLQTLLKKVQDRKSQLQSFICRFTSKENPDLIYKPRNAVLAKVPPKLDDFLVRTMTNPEHPLKAQILSSSENVCVNSSKVPRLALPPQQSDKKDNIYDCELNLLLSKMRPNGELTQEEKSRVLSILAFKDFTCHGKTMCGLVLYLKYSYDFIPRNPLLLLSARWSFIPKVEKIVRCVLRKRKGYQKDSEFRYSEYQAKYAKWKLKKIEPETFSENRGNLQRKIDIYGRESRGTSPILLPKTGDLAGLTFSLDHPLIPYQLRKESMDVDPDICTFVC